MNLVTISFLIMKELKALHGRAELTESILNVAVTKIVSLFFFFLSQPLEKSWLCWTSRSRLSSQQDGQFEELLDQNPELPLLGSGPMWQENVLPVVSVDFLPSNKENKMRFCILLIIISSPELENW